MADQTKPPRMTKRARLDAAFRVRAGAIGLLTCCTCEYPLNRYPTASRQFKPC